MHEIVIEEKQVQDLDLLAMGILVFPQNGTVA
jgi:hypothetical protein